MATLDAALQNVDHFEIVVPPTADRHKVFADVAAVYDNRKVELTEEGHIIIASPAGLEGGYLSGEVFFQLANWARKTGTGKAFDSSAGFYVTPNQNRSPDAAWVSNARIASIPKQDRQAFAPFCPDFAIEVRSPSNNLDDLRAKCRAYVENGASQAWLIDPKRQLVEVFTEQNPSANIEHREVVLRGTGPLTGFELDLTPIWQGL